MTHTAKLNAAERRSLFRTRAFEARYRPRRLAVLCGVSLRQLERYFHSDFGCAPAIWLQRERIRIARRLLSRAETIKEVAYTLGFSSLGHFSTRFKRETGLSPRDYLAESQRHHEGPDGHPRV